MDQNKIAGLIRKGETDVALKMLEELRPQVDSAHKIEIDLITARFNTLQKDLMLNQISYEEGNREMARITHVLLQLAGKIFGTPKTSKESIKAEVELLGLSYEFIDEENISINLRWKNDIIRAIYEYFNEYPDLIPDFRHTTEQAIIAAIALRQKIVPNINELNTLKQISKNASSNFTKGHIVNALAEFVYSGQLRFGDETIIFETLNLLKTNADVPLQKNIERVKIALQYFLGQIK